MLEEWESIYKASNLLDTIAFFWPGNSLVLMMCNWVRFYCCRYTIIFFIANDIKIYNLFNTEIILVFDGLFGSILMVEDQEHAVNNPQTLSGNWNTHPPAGKLDELASSTDRERHESFNVLISINIIMSLFVYTDYVHITHAILLRLVIYWVWWM
jgi:hypothetical protein